MLLWFSTNNNSNVKAIVIVIVWKVIAIVIVLIYDVIVIIIVIGCLNI